MSGEEQDDSSRVQVVIMGQPYKVRAEEDGAYIEELARFVDTKMGELAKETGTSEPLKVAILAALNIADELFKSEEEVKRADEEIATRAAEITETLRASLRAPTETSPAI